MECLLLAHCNNGCTNASQCYVIRPLNIFCTSYLPQYTNITLLFSCRISHSELKTFRNCRLDDKDRIQVTDMDLNSDLGPGFVTEDEDNRTWQHSRRVLCDTLNWRSESKSLRLPTCNWLQLQQTNFTWSILFITNLQQNPFHRL